MSNTVDESSTPSGPPLGSVGDQSGNEQTAAQPGPSSGTAAGAPAPATGIKRRRDADQSLPILPWFRPSYPASVRPARMFAGQSGSPSDLQENQDTDGDDTGENSESSDEPVVYRPPSPPRRPRRRIPHFELFTAWFRRPDCLSLRPSANPDPELMHRVLAQFYRHSGIYEMADAAAAEMNRQNRQNPVRNPN